MEGAELRIAGNPVPKTLKSHQSDPGVSLDGFVEDIREWLGRCGVYVMPMFQGGGVKNKLLEGMAAGLPIVTNSMGAEAMPVDSRCGFIVADGLEEITAAILDLLEHPEKADALSKRARAYAEKNFCWEPLSEKYARIVAEVAAE